MLRPSVGLLALLALTLSACDDGAAGQSDTVSASEAAAIPAPVDDAGSARSAETSGVNATAVAASPAYAEIYPGAVADQPAIEADGAAGPGGAVTFIADVAPHMVVDFYRQRAEAAGLTSMTALSQGDTHAYGASGEGGAALQVVAAPDGDGRTSVQLTWSAGR